MKLRQILPVLIAGIAIGVLAFLLQMTQSVDSDLHARRLDAIRTVNNLDVEINRVFTQSRYSSLADADNDRGAITRRLGEALDAIDKGSASLRGLSPKLDKDLDTFLETIENKFELGFDFEARNALLYTRLINSTDSVQTHVAAINAASASIEPAVRDRLLELSGRLRSEMVNFSITPTPSNQEDIRAILAELATLAETQPESIKASLNALRISCDEVIADKTELVDKLRDFLNRPTGPQLQVVESSYAAWYQAEVATANEYRLILVGYAAALLLGLALLGLRLRRSFREIDRANDELKNANEHLEEQVEARTKDLSGALNELRSSQAQLVQSEKMASLGQMVAGVAHEINTPLGYARSNAEIVRNALGEIRELCTVQDRALSLLTSADAAEEEIAAALGEAEARRQDVNATELMADLEGLLADTDHGLVQIADLVSSLKDFSRVDRSRTDLFDVNAGIESALKIANNQLKNRIEVVRQFGALPQIECSPSQLNQVFLNLFTNAAQAIDGDGRIYIHTVAEAGGVAIRVMDTGCGMSEEVRQHIFEPFFTTKPVGKGTGLGLSIVFRIIEEHGGRIAVKSAPGKGSEFIIQLPLRQPRKGAEPEAPAAQPAPELAAA
jgi:two-component system NtrC family sensor kinase